MSGFPVLPLASFLHGHSSLLLSEVLARFQEAKVELQPKGEEEVEREPVLAILFLTGGTESQALHFLHSRRKPVLLLAHAGHNSLPAALETMARLQEEGRKVWLVPENSAERISLFAKAAELARALLEKRIGWIGGASPWLLAAAQTAVALEEKLGMKIVPIPVSKLLAELSEPEGAAEGPGEGVGEAERRMALQVYSALERIAKEEKLFALSLACFELLPHRLTACYALARLSDQGLPAGCEGDLPGLLGLILARLLTGQSGFLGNPVEIDLKRERLLLAHCTVPFSLTEDFLFRSHFESGIGLGVAGRLKPGAYTVLRFGGPRLEKIFVAEGTVLSESPGREDLCRTQVWFKISKGALAKLLRQPLGNHHVLIPGHHRPLLLLFHELFLGQAT